MELLAHEITPASADVIDLTELLRQSLRTKTGSGTASRAFATRNRDGRTCSRFTSAPLMITLPTRVEAHSEGQRLCEDQSAEVGLTLPPRLSQPGLFSSRFWPQTRPQLLQGAGMFEQALKNINDILHKDAGRT